VWVSSAFNWSRVDPDPGFCEYCDETLGSDKDNAELTSLITVNFFNEYACTIHKSLCAFVVYYRNCSRISNLSM
jgi:hypothetical protein